MPQLLTNILASCILFMTFLIGGGNTLFAQMKISFNYEEDGNSYKGEVVVGFKTIDARNREFNFSQVSRLTHEAIEPGVDKIIVWFSDLEWDKPRHKRNFVLYVDPSKGKTPGLSKSGRPLALKHSMGEERMEYTIKGNGTGNIMLSLVVDDGKGNRSPYAGAIRKNYTIRSEESAWGQAKSQHTIPAYNNFLADYPDGTYANSARDAIRKLRVSTWDVARQQDTKTAYERYLASEPNGVHVEEAKYYLETLDDEDWDDAKQVNTNRGYQQYIDKWSRGYRGAHLNSALRAMQGYKPDPDNNTPKTPPKPDADASAWQEAEAADTPAAYKGYLNAFPSGRFRGEAIRRIPIELLSTTRAGNGGYVLKFEFATGELRLDKVDMELLPGEEMPPLAAGMQEIIAFDQGGAHRYDYRKGMLIAEDKGEQTLEFSSEMARTFTVVLKDETGLEIRQKLEFGIPPLKIASFKDEEGNLDFTLEGGKPPYFLEIKIAGRPEVVQRLELGEPVQHHVEKASLQSRYNLKGSYDFVFSDQRKTEAVVQADVPFEGQTYWRWVLLGAGLLLVGLLLFSSLRPKSKRKY